MPDGAPQVAAPAPGAPASALPRGLRVLVVDDSDDAAATMALLLQMSGYETCTAADGLQALQRAKAFVPDVVLLDLGLPDLSGDQVAQRLRDEPGGSRLLVVALTGRPRQLDGPGAGFDAHLVKPVNLDQLFGLLERHRVAADAAPAVSGPS